MRALRPSGNPLGRARRLLRAALRRDIAWPSLRTALVVGTVLNLINQGHLLMAGAAISGVHALLNFAVPYLVASYSAARHTISQTDAARDRS
jgi:hypothetical protein